MSETYHHGDLRRHLVVTAMEMLRENADAEISLRSVARRAGVSPAAPYRHYPDKAALLAALAADGFRALRALVASADSKAGKDGAIAAQAVAYVRFALANPGLFHLMFGAQGASSSAERRLAGEAAYEVLVGRVATVYSDDGLTQIRALAFWSAMHGLATLAIDGRLAGKGNAAVLMKRIIDLFEKS